MKPNRIAPDAKYEYRNGSRVEFKGGDSKYSSGPQIPAIDYVDSDLTPDEYEALMKYLSDRSNKSQVKE